MTKTANDLSSNIRLLGDLLGQTIIDQENDEVFATVEKIRNLFKAKRSGDADALAKIDELIPQLVDNLPLAMATLKSFSSYFQLINLAEERERVRVLRDRLEKARSDGAAMDETILAAIGTLKSSGVDADQMQGILNSLEITPVFTAHPTESKRRTFRQMLASVSMLLKQYVSEENYESDREEIRERIHDHIVLMWQSDETRDRRPTVMDEVRNSGIYFFERTLFDLIPKIYEELEAALAEHWPDHTFEIPSFLKYGSWIGGDRDGNPFVTTEVTEEALREHQAAILKHYRIEADAFYGLLSPSVNRSGFSQPFLDSLEDDMQLVPDDEKEVFARFSQEPYRQKMIWIFRRLKANQTQNEQSWDTYQPHWRAYQSSDELLHDLKTVRDSLMDNKGQRLVSGRLERFIRAVEVFGFHLTTLDVRQHARIHREAISEILARNETVAKADDYGKLAEAEKVELLSQEISSKRPFTGGHKAGVKPLSESTTETLALFRKIRQAQQIVGPESMQTYIISMTEGCSNLLEVLLMSHDAGMEGTLDIVPLFETVADLKAAPEIMTSLFNNPVYAEHLKLRGGKQQIMIGYSDSNKDGGYLRANWMLFTAQRKLAEVCQQHGITMTLFHGRGGSLGRGGGPANRAILAQPAESVKGRIRITEQGEVVSSRYGKPGIAHRHLEQLTHAVLCSTIDRPVPNKAAEWARTMDELSELAFKKYRSLVEHENFLPYFQTATPIDQIGQMNIGSRPAHRRATRSLGDLRAIPWVFAWTQSRADVPSWYGVGTAVTQWFGDDPANRESKLAELTGMFRDWPFFKTLMGNLHLGLGRADMEIMKHYAGLAPESVGQTLFDNVRSEYELTRKVVLEISGEQEILATEPWLQKSIRVRNPYVDPLNYIQVELLRRFRADPEQQDADTLRQGILQSINGIAAGLQTVG